MIGRCCCFASSSLLGSGGLLDLISWGFGRLEGMVVKHTAWIGEEKRHNSPDDPFIDGIDIDDVDVY